MHFRLSGFTYFLFSRQVQHLVVTVYHVSLIGLDPTDCGRVAVTILMYSKQDQFKISIMKTDPQMDPHKEIHVLDTVYASHMWIWAIWNSMTMISPSIPLIRLPLSSREKTIANQLKDTRAVRTCMNALFYAIKSATVAKQSTLMFFLGCFNFIRAAWIMLINSTAANLIYIYVLLLIT